MVVRNLNLCIHYLAGLFFDLVIFSLEIRLGLAGLCKEVLSGCLAPFLSILDLDLSQDNSDVSILLHDVLHTLEFLKLVLSHSIFYKIKQRKLADSLQYYVDHFDIQS